MGEKVVLLIVWEKYMIYFLEYCISIMFVPLLAVLLISYGVFRRYKSRMAYIYQMKYLAFIASSFIFEKLSGRVYCDISYAYAEMNVVQSGLLLIIILIITGKVINSFYSMLAYGLKVIGRLDVENDEKSFMLVAMTILCALDFIVINKKVTLFCFSLLLGKLFWLDTGLVPIRCMIREIQLYWNKISISAKNKSLAFAWIVLLSNYLGYIAQKRIRVVADYVISTYFAVGFGIVYIMYCTFMSKRDEIKWKKLNQKNKQ